MSSTTTLWGKSSSSFRLCEEHRRRTHPGSVGETVHSVLEMRRSTDAGLCQGCCICPWSWWGCWAHPDSVGLSEEHAVLISGLCGGRRALSRCEVEMPRWSWFCGANAVFTPGLWGERRVQPRSAKSMPGRQFIPGLWCRCCVSLTDWPQTLAESVEPSTLSFLRRANTFALLAEIH